MKATIMTQMEVKDARFKYDRCKIHSLLNVLKTATNKIVLPLLLGSNSWEFNEFKTFIHNKTVFPGKHKHFHLSVNLIFHTAFKKSP